MWAVGELGAWGCGRGGGSLLGVADLVPQVQQDVWGRTGLRSTMPAARARQAAENAGGAAYADAVSGYAALEWDGLPAAARKLLAPTSGRG
ncbi:hypothetical protein [Streptomyces atratus]|uniref:hypothetical protein n=1 Tax=Streptomyces atratus TaxID=1893 RepID=UPI0033F63278